MTAPTTDRAYAAGGDAPAGVMAVEVALAVDLEVCTGEAGCIAVDHRGHEHGPMHRDRAACEAWIERKPPERTVTYWVGLDPDMGAVNVDAAIRRAETDKPRLHRAGLGRRLAAAPAGLPPAVMTLQPNERGWAMPANDTEGGRFFRVTLSEDQHRTIEQAIRDLNAGDEDSARENDDLLAAFLGSTEEVR